MGSQSGNSSADTRVDQTGKHSVRSMAQHWAPSTAGRWDSPMENCWGCSTAAHSDHQTAAHSAHHSAHHSAQDLESHSEEQTAAQKAVPTAAQKARHSAHLMADSMAPLKVDSSEETHQVATEYTTKNLYQDSCKDHCSPPPKLTPRSTTNRQALAARSSTRPRSAHKGTSHLCRTLQANSIASRTRRSP